MRSCGQFCPIARGSEILAERWTPIILRNLLLGCPTFNDPDVVLWSWAQTLLRRDLLPDRRVVVRFEHARMPAQHCLPARDPA